jgi:hypothetical protein
VSASVSAEPATRERDRWLSHLRLFTSLRGYRGEWLNSDLIAGLTVWAVLVPAFLASATIGRRLARGRPLRRPAGADLVRRVLLLLYRISRPYVAELGEVSGAPGQCTDLDRHPETGARTRCADDRADRNRAAAAAAVVRPAGGVVEAAGYLGHDES